MEGARTFPPQLFCTAGCRLGKALKRLNYNAMRYNPVDVMPSDDLLKRTEKDFEVKRLLKRDPDRHVCINDISHLLRCGREGLGNRQNAIIALVRQKSSVVAARGLVNAFVLMEFIGFY